MSGVAAKAVNQYGQVCSPSQVASFIEHCIRVNIKAVKKGKLDNKVVPCVWGPAGIAKTSMFKQLEKVGVRIGDRLYYPKVIHVTLAEIEEAGDLTGLPVVAQTKGEMDENGDPVTKYASPAWWPKPKDALDENGQPRPIILLIDDFNRADPRILKAIMALLQFSGTNAHTLPEWTTIGLTGNPPQEDDGTDYMVNEIDKAIKTRMLHISMEFNKQDWGVWAEGEGIDKRVMNFVFRHPEMVDGKGSERTNPRSIVDLANLIEDIPNLVAEAELVSMCARSCVDETVAVAFETFTIGELQEVVEPEEILNSWQTAKPKLDALARRGGKEGAFIRTDIVGIICDRLFVYLMQPALKLENRHYENFLKFISQEADDGQLKYIPEDAMYTLLRRLRRDAATPQQEKMISDMIRYGGKKIARLIMNIA